MRRSSTAICAGALLAAALSAIPDRHAVAADDILRVCLEENLPPASVHKRGKPDSGFDVLLAQAVARQLQRPLHIQWFETRLDEDSDPALEANALLSDGRCALLGGYPLTKNSLVVPGVKTAKLPDFDGATRDDRRRRIELGVLTPTRPYIYSALTIVLGSKARDRQIKDLGDLSTLRIGVESGTLADAILMNFGKGRLIDQITHLVPGRSDLLGELERGELDATLVDTRRLDAWRATHADSNLAGSGYYYPIGANRAYVALAGDGALIAAVNKVLTDLEANGTIEEFAKTSGLTYLKPREPIVLGDVLPQILQNK